jgi:putative ABC transport system permease protein
VLRLWQDLRHAFRLIARAPGFAAIAVLSIAFGTGANIAIFSTADALLLRPLPVEDWSSLVTVGTTKRREVSIFNVSSYPDYADVRDRARSFTGLTGFAHNWLGVSAHAGEPPQVRPLTIVTSNYFDVLGVDVAMGRAFLPDEDREGAPPTVVLSHRLWQSMFAGDPHVLGRRLRIAGIDCEIVGVAPAAFWGLNQRYIPELAFLPIGMWPRLPWSGGMAVADAPAFNPLTARDADLLTVKGRLRPDVTMAEAQAEADVIAADLARQHPATNAHQDLLVQTEMQVKTAADPFSTGALMLLGLLSLSVLAVGCTNVAGLLASRAPIRAREIALRLAIGASRARIFRQLMTESLVIALAGGVGGIAVGYAGVALLGQIRYPSDVIATPQAVIDERALTVAIILAMASAVLFGLVPAWQATRTNLIRPLKAGDAGGGRLRLTGRNVLVAIQVTLSLALVTIAVFTSQAFERIFREGPGFRVTNMAKLSVAPEQAGYRGADATAFFDRLLTDVRRLSGVTTVGVASAMPLFSFETSTIAAEGEQAGDDQPRPTSVANRIDEGYFETMKIPLLAGRPFLASDVPASPRVAIVNDTLASYYWPGEPAIGKRIRVPPSTEWIEIVGVVRTSKYWFPGENPQRAAYFPFRQHPAGRLTILAATPADSRTLIEPMREVVRAIDADVPVYDATTIEDFYDARATSFGDVLLRLVSGMGLMGMTLTITGLYGLVSYAASRRTREIGIRIAIGASPGRVLTMIMRQGMRPAWLGMIAGVGVSLMTGELLAAEMPIAFDYSPQALVAILPILVIVTAIAAAIPARRASRVSPTVALRAE